ncbi:MAG TPA: cytochrome c oxidase subunit II [Bacteroidia bacterium]|nr:cytochrome c oxidase subunit II [Bacteroidia bacterium]
MSFLLLLAVALSIFVMVRLMNIVQLAAELSGESEEGEMNRDNKINGVLLMGFMIAGLAVMVYMTLRYNKFMLPVAASEHGVETDNLLNWNFAVIGLVFFITQIALFWFAYKYRFSKERRAYFYPDNHKLELIWTIIPTIVLSALIVTGLASWNKITQSNHTDGMKVEIYGYQFNWLARYAGVDNKLGASNFKLITDENALGVNYKDTASFDDIMTTPAEMHLPVNIPINMVFHAREVLHSAYFPHFRTQMNCVPGMSTVFYFKPTITTEEMRKITKNDKFDYVLLCNKVCGTAHYTMHMKVVVESPDDFKKWLKTQKPVMGKPAADSKIAEATNTAEEIKQVAMK